MVVPKFSYKIEMFFNVKTVMGFEVDNFMKF